MKHKKHCGLTPLEACDLAADLLRRAGFVFDHAAMNGSTSTYYKYPGRIGFLRVSTHRTAKKATRTRHFSQVNVASVTFSHKAIFADGTLIMKESTIEAEVCSAIGRFLIVSEAA